MSIRIDRDGVNEDGNLSFNWLNTVERVIYLIN